jgi:hypothetical protein
LEGNVGTFAVKLLCDDISKHIYITEMGSAFYKRAQLDNGMLVVFTLIYPAI